MSMSKPACAQRGEVGDRRLRARQDDEIGVARQRRARPHRDQLDRGLGVERIEIVEVGDVRQDRHRDAHARLRLRGQRSIERERILGRQTAARRGRTERGRAPPSRCARAIVAMPSANSAGSPRNLLTRKPRIIAASSASITALVPTRLAITPPRSISPISTTGTSAARAKPILAMSLRAQIDFRRAAGAFHQHDVGLARRRAKLSSTNGSSVGFMLLIGGGLGGAVHAALHHDLRADLALRLQQHRVHVHARRRARGARLQRLRAADLAAVRGHRRVVRHVLRLERPHREAAVGERARQAGDDQRLADIRPGALEHERAGSHRQNSMPGCAFTPAAKWCFTSVISVTRSAAAISSGLALRPVTTTCSPAPARAQRGDDRLQVEILVAQRDVELVEDDQPEAGSAISSSAFAQARSAAAMSRVRSCVSQVKPSPIVCQTTWSPNAASASRSAGMPSALDELHHADAMAAAEHAQSKPERGRRLALAGAGMDDQQTLLDRLSGDLGVLHGFALCHLGAMALGLGVVDGVAHRGPFTLSGSPATTSTTRSARAARRWLSRPCRVAEPPRERVVGHDAEPDLVGDQHHQAPSRARECLFQPAISASTSASASMRLRQPERQTVDQNGRSRRRSRKRQREIMRRLDRAASRLAAPRPVAAMRSAISSSPASAGRHIDPGRRQAMIRLSACRLLPERAPPRTSVSRYAGAAWVKIRRRAKVARPELRDRPRRSARLQSAAPFRQLGCRPRVPSLLWRL